MSLKLTTQNQRCLALYPRGRGLHHEKKLTTPNLPLKATETHAYTQDPNALHLPRLPDHPHTLRLSRATYAYPLHPAALAFVSYGIVLVQVQVPFTQPTTPGHEGGVVIPPRGFRNAYGVGLVRRGSSGSCSSGRALLSCLGQFIATLSLCTQFLRCFPIFLIMDACNERTP
jgi:hypothetical protein